jgi:anthranilate phosphoribosyltransferase
MDSGPVFDRLLSDGSFNAQEAESIFTRLLTGGYDDARIGAMLALIARRSPTVDELVGGARAMRRFVTPIPASNSGGPIIDTCGTGGAPKTFNISTVGAIVTAAAAGPERVRVAKHGNRSRSGRGSAEVLATLGVNVDAAPGVQADSLDRIGVCFCFAIHHHPAMKHAAGVRRALAFPTIFNLLGPLTNPAAAPRQLIGVYGASEAEKVADALAALGADRAMVVHGDDGIDEISTRTTTRLFHVEAGTVRREIFDSASLGFERPAEGSLEARDLDDAVRLFRAVLAGEPGPARDIVTLNAGAALFVAGAAPSIRDGVTLANAAIDRGDAARTLDELIAISHGR